MPKPCQLFVQKYASRHYSLESFQVRPVAAEPFCSRKWKIDRQAVHDPFLCRSKVATQISNFYRMRSRPFLRSAGWGAVSSVVVSVSKKKATELWRVWTANTVFNTRTAVGLVGPLQKDGPSAECPQTHVGENLVCYINFCWDDSWSVSVWSCPPQVTYIRDVVVGINRLETNSERFYSKFLYWMTCYSGYYTCPTCVDLIQYMTKKKPANS